VCNICKRYEHHKILAIFLSCNIIKPVTLTSSVSPDRKPRKERNSPLRILAHYYNQNRNTNEAMEAYTHTKQPPAKPFIGFQTQISQNEAMEAGPLLQRFRHMRSNKAVPRHQVEHGSLVIMQSGKLCLLPSKSLHDRPADMTLRRLCILYKIC
jgi:hypothetical protein